MLGASTLLACSVSVSSFSIQPPSLQSPSSMVKGMLDSPTHKHRVTMTRFMSEESQNIGDGDADSQQVFDMDKMVSINELNILSQAIGGPMFDDNYPIESAKGKLWNFVEGRAEDDIDKMCMGQLSSLMFKLTGKEFEDGLTLEEAREQVWELANVLSNALNESSCAGCASCSGK